MKAYTYNDVSWRVHGEINRGTVAVHYLNAKESHRSRLTSFLGHAAGVMTHTSKPGPITYTITEVEDGYSFRMVWGTSRVKAEAIKDYTEQLKGPDHPETGKTQWRLAVVHDLRALLAFSSAFGIGIIPMQGTDLFQVCMEARVKFSSLVDTPHVARLYVDGPQRQVSIFDLFTFQWLNRNDLEMAFIVGDAHDLAVRINVPGGHAVLTLGDHTCAHRNLVRFLEAMRNIIHGVDEKVPLVNVASMRTTRYYSNDDFANGYRVADEDDEPWPSKAEVLHTRYVHYRNDGTHCSMDIRNLHGWGKQFNVLIRENADLVQEDNWFYRSCGEHLQPASHHAQPIRAQLEAPVRLAFTADEHDLRNAVRLGFGLLAEQLGSQGYKATYKADLPTALVDEI